MRTTTTLIGVLLLTSLCLCLGGCPPQIHDDVPEARPDAAFNLDGGLHDGYGGDARG